MTDRMERYKQISTSYHNITKDLYNHNVTQLEKINLIARLEQDIIHLSNDLDNLEILIKTMLDFLKGLIGSPTIDDSIFKLEKKSPFYSQLVNKVMILLTNLVIFYDKIEPQSDGGEDYIKDFINFMICYIEKISSTKNRKKDQSLICNRTITSSCIKQLCKFTNIATRSVEIKNFKSNQGNLTSFLVTSEVEVLVGEEFDNIINKLVETDIFICNQILSSLSESLLETVNNDVISSKLISMSSIKQFITELSSKKDIECIHLMLLLMLKSKYRVFSPQSELAVMQNLCDLSFDQSSSNSQRLLALDLVRDLATRTSQPDMLYNEMLKPKSGDKVDTLEKKMCIITLCQSISDDELLRLIRNIVSNYVEDSRKNVRIASSIFRILSFVINERNSVVPDLEDVAFELATNKCNLLNHCLRLMQAQPSISESLASRLMEYLVLYNKEHGETYDESSGTSQNQLVLFELLAINQKRVSESHLMSLLDIVAKRIITHPSKYDDYLERFSEIFWKCKIDDVMRHKIKSLMKRMLSQSSDPNLSVWIQLLTNALQLIDFPTSISDMKICDKLEQIFVDQANNCREYMKDCSSNIVSPFLLKRLDHINYASFPPANTSFKLVFSVTLNDESDISHMQQVFCLSVDILQDDRETATQVVEIPILKKNVNKKFEVVLSISLPNPFMIKFNYKFTDEYANSYKYVNCDSVEINTKDLLFPLYPEYNNLNYIDVDRVWKELSSDQKSIETVILIQDSYNIEDFFAKRQWLSVYKLSSQAEGYSNDTQSLLCILPNEKILLMKLSTVNSCVKVEVMTDEYRAIDHLFHLLSFKI